MKIEAMSFDGAILKLEVDLSDIIAKDQHVGEIHVSTDPLSDAEMREEPLFVLKITGCR